MEKLLILMVDGIKNEIKYFNYKNLISFILVVGRPFIVGRPYFFSTLTRSLKCGDEASIITHSVSASSW